MLRSATWQRASRRIHELDAALSKKQALWYNVVVDPDVEARARAIVLEAKAARKRLPRWLWVVSLVIAVGCTGALAMAWVADRDTVPAKPLERHGVEHSSGLGLGLLVGLGAGIAIGGVVALRRRD